MKKYIEAYLTNRLDSLNINRLKDIYEGLSETYRRHQTPPSLSIEQVLSYLLARFPATFGVCHAVLTQLNYLKLKPLTLLEVGAGPGTGILAALEYFSTLTHVTLLEKEENFLSAAREIFSLLRKERPLDVAYLRQSYTASASLPIHDLVIASYFLNELSPNLLPSVIESLWASTGQYLILIEPGTPVGFNIIRHAREILIKQNATITAPCTHNNACPINGNDWCHFSVRIQRDKHHRSIKGPLSYEDEKYSYIIASKKPVCLPIGSRIIKKPLHHTGHLVLPLCTENGLENLTLTKGKDKQKYKAAGHLKWETEFKKFNLKKIR